MFDSKDDSEALRRRARELARYSDWEAEQEAGRERTLSADLAWLWDAILLARRLAPDEDTLESARERGRRRAAMLAALSVLDRPAA
ncbi:MAG: hypothetical protein IT348_12475 [Candidatus Eisenbacteria bacterium]|nr:hypothetical protein [Candidatus Eisenbacteria bacterium]